MPLQDLTPQLRTRLSRLERWVGVFVIAATLLLLAGLTFYVYQTAQRKGWFQRKLPFFTFVRSAAGLKVGQPVKLMGLDVGEITDIQPQPPGDFYDMFVAFVIQEPYEGYLWSDSRAKVASSDLLGNRVIEVTKGTSGPPAYLFRELKELNLAEAESAAAAGRVRSGGEIFDFNDDVLVRPFEVVRPDQIQDIAAASGLTTLKLIVGTNQTRNPTGLWSDREGAYLPFDRSGSYPDTAKGYFLLADEAPALGDRLEKVVSSVENALPNVLALTNHLQGLFRQASNTAARADDVLTGVRPAAAHLVQITSNLTNSQGALGTWLVSSNLAPLLTGTLSNANSLLTNSDSQLTGLAVNLDLSLENLANLTSNLNSQVGANTNLVGGLADLIRETDALVQGLKRHWLLRSAFKKPPGEGDRVKPSPHKLRSPRDRD